MKKLTALSFALLAVTGFASSAFAAPTIVHVVGSTAFRAPVTAAIIQFLNDTPAPGGGLHAAVDHTSSSLLGANACILANGTIASDGSGTATYVVECYWTGSLAGVVDLASASATDIFLDESTLTVTDIGSFNTSSVTVGNLTNSSVYGGGTVPVLIASVSSPTNPGVLVTTPDLAMSDSLNTTIRSELSTCDGYPAVGGIGNTTTLAQLLNEISGISATITNAGTGSGGALTHNLVGVVPFQWAIGAINATGTTTMGTTTIPNNMAQQTAKALLANGFVSQGFLTGTNTAADKANFFYLTGRNEDSGTRIGAFAESQFGVTSAPFQYQIVAGTPNTVAGSYNQFPGGTVLNTETSLSWSAQGHSGYATGSNVKAALNLTESGTITNNDSPTTAAPGGVGAFFIGYLGVTDASGVVGGTLMNYNGVPFSIAAVESGLYTFYTFEHTYKLKTLTSGNLNTAVNGIADDIYKTTVDVSGTGKHTTTYNGATASGELGAGVPYPLMSFSRSSSQPEGTPIVP